MRPQRRRLVELAGAAEVQLPSPIPHPLQLLDVPQEAWWILEFAVGADWPEGNEKLVWDLADDWYAAAEALVMPGQQANAAALEVMAGWGGPGTEVPDAFWQAWEQLGTGGFDVLVQACVDYGAAVEGCGCDIEAAKIEVWIETTILAIEIVACLVAAAFTFGAALAGTAPAMFATRFIIGQIFKKLLRELAERGLSKGVREGLERVGEQVAKRGLGGFVKRGSWHAFEEGLEEVGTDFVVQNHQLERGRRDGYDIDSLLLSAGGGAAGGFAGGLAGLGGHATSAVGRFGENLARGAAGEVLGEFGASLATGQGVPDVDDLSRSLTSGALSGSLQAGRESADRALEALAFNDMPDSGAVPDLAGLAGLAAQNQQSPLAADQAAPLPPMAEPTGAPAWEPGRANEPDHGADPDTHAGSLSTPSSLNAAPASDPGLLPEAARSVDSAAPPDAAPSSPDSAASPGSAPLVGGGLTQAEKPIEDQLAAIDAALGAGSSQLDGSSTLALPSDSASPHTAAPHAAAPHTAVPHTSAPHLAATVVADAPVVAGPRADVTPLPASSTPPGSPPVSSTPGLGPMGGPAAAPVAVGRAAVPVQTPPVPSQPGSVGPDHPPAVSADVRPARPVPTAPPEPTAAPVPVPPRRVEPAPPQRIVPPPRSAVPDTPEGLEGEAADARWAMCDRWAEYELDRRDDSVLALNEQRTVVAAHVDALNSQLRFADPRDARWDTIKDRTRDLRNVDDDLAAQVRDIPYGKGLPAIVEVDLDSHVRLNTELWPTVAGPVESDDRSALTGDDRPRSVDRTRPYGERGGLREPLVVDQVILERAMPRDDEGRTQRWPDPRLAWFTKVNDGGPAADPTRGINCIDTVLSLFETYVHGRPRVAAPRTFDAYRHGDPADPVGGERGGLARAQRVLGAPFSTFFGSNRPWTSYDSGIETVRRQLLAGGPGSFAMLAHSRADGGSHTWAAVNHGGVILFLDPQSGALSANPIFAGHGIDRLDAIVLDSDAQPIPHGDADSWDGPDPTGFGRRLPMTMDCVHRTAEKFGLDVSDLTIRIDKARAGYAGVTSSDEIITFTRSAFLNEEELARTIAHERFHVEQIRSGMGYPETYDENNSWEQEAKAFEERWWRTVGSQVE